MPLPLPVLDRRTWPELVAEARSLLPRYARDWSDHNVHDAGITLVELFAWLSELLLFRADRVPAAELRAFLRWLGIEQRPAGVASTFLALEAAPGGPAVPLAGGLQVDDVVSGEAFEADAALVVSPAWLELAPASPARGQIWSRAGGAFAELGTGNCGGSALLPFGAAPEVGNALWLGFDCGPGAPGDVLSLYVWTTDWRSDADLRTRLIDDDDTPICPAPPPAYPTLNDCIAAACGGPEPAAPPAPQPTWFLHYSARTVWEGWDGTAWTPWHVIADETRALSLSGPVRLEAATLQPDPPEAPVVGYRWLRCRLAAGSYECPPRLAGVAINALEARHAVRVAGPELLGVSRGHAQETYTVDGRIAAAGAGAAPQPLVDGSLRLRLVHPADPPDDDWHEVPTWDRSGPFDKHCVADPQTNAVRFGDGRVGRVPPADWTVEALEYRVGGGPRGNVPAGRLTHVLAGGGAGVTIHQPFDAVGGAPAESLDQTHGRALELLATPERGVTAEDWETLALDVPGAPVARVAVLPGFHPDYPCWDALGVVTVVVVPRCGNPPRPSSDFLAFVERRLRRRRPLTTELHVVGPTYVRVDVSATLHVEVAQPALAAIAQAALDELFDPLTGGPGAGGWPFGRGVLETDLLATLARLPGVTHVDDVRIAADGCAARCDNLVLCPTDLVESGTHSIQVVVG
jgi:predicted phage baseplate assembly protein